MTEQPATIAREAKNIYQSLKELLRTKEPFDKELEFQRKNLRRRYLTLLLLHPYAKETKDVENHLWMQTSYASISSYKERIAAIDRAVQQANARQQGEGGQPQAAPRQRHGPVEHRKLLSRFRQFLAEEEKFWIQLVLRMYRSFGLEEAQPALTALGIILDSQDVDESHDGASAPHGRYSFPEEPTTSLAPSNAAERESRLAILSKALICLGDIARYRELYNESGGRPKAGQESGRPARRGKGRRGGLIDQGAQLRVYDNAQQRYEHARLLVPQDGNPFHQLAILATYRKDTLASLYYYYRALCVRQPYETAADNLTTVLQKALDQWKRSRKDRDRMLAAGNFDTRDRIQLFKERIVVLHALWRKGLDKTDAKFREHDKIVYQDFRELVEERHLSIDLISNVIVLAQSGLWKHRMIRDSSGHSSGRKQETQTPPSVEPSTTTEWRMVHHLLDMHFALLEIGRDQLKDLPSMDKVDNDPAQRITAVFRRTLPALRIASKWLRANLGYVMSDLEFQAYQEKEKLRSVSVEKKCAKKISAHSVHTIRFWKGYAQFVSALSQAFPASKLPSLTAPLEEDIDLRGFLPLKKFMTEALNATSDLAAGTGQAKESPHPNEEQLMRISDLLADAQALLSAENSPLVSVNSTITFSGTIVEPRKYSLPDANKPPQPVPVRQQQIMNHIRDTSAEVLRPRDDDVMTEATSRTDDDVLKAAFQHIGGDVEDDEDDDIVLYNPKGSLSPALSPIMQATPVTPAKSLNGSGAPKTFSSPPLNKLSPHIAKTPIGSPRAQPIAATTAQDLLLDVMNAGRKPGAGLSLPPVDPAGIQPPWLFGSELSNRPAVQSIWSAGRDEQVLKFGSPGHHHAFQTSPRLYSHGIGGGSQDMSASIWSSSHPSSTQSSQVHMGGVLPSGVHPNQPNAIGMHHRIPSSSGPQHIPYQGSLSLHHGEVFVNSPSSLSIPKPPLLQSHQSFYSPDLRSDMVQLQGPSSFFSQLPTNGHEFHDPLGRQGYQSQPTSLQDTRIGQATHMTSPISHIWGNHG